MYAKQIVLEKSTYLEYGSERLRSLIAVCGMTRKTPEIMEVFRQMTTSWGDKVIEMK